MQPDSLPSISDVKDKTWTMGSCRSQRSRRRKTRTTTSTSARLSSRPPGRSRGPQVAKAAPEVGVKSVRGLHCQKGMPPTETRLFFHAHPQTRPKVLQPTFFTIFTGRLAQHTRVAPPVSRRSPAAVTSIVPGDVKGESRGLGSWLAMPLPTCLTRKGQHGTKSRKRSASQSAANVDERTAIPHFQPFLPSRTPRPHFMTASTRARSVAGPRQL